MQYSCDTALPVVHVVYASHEYAHPSDMHAACGTVHVMPNATHAKLVTIWPVHFLGHFMNMAFMDMATKLMGTGWSFGLSAGIHLLLSSVQAYIHCWVQCRHTSACWAQCRHTYDCCAQCRHTYDC